MGSIDILNHLLNFVAPALAVSLALVLATALLFRQAPAVVGRWAQWVILSLVLSAVSFAALVAWGRDGKMMGYAALVLVGASVQWVLLRGWR